MTAPPVHKNRQALLARELEPYIAAAQTEIMQARLALDPAARPDVEARAQARWLADRRGDGYRQRYLTSQLWKCISHEVQARAGYACATGCGRLSEVVHHRSYDFATLSGQDDSQLVALCHPCHRRLHGPQGLLSQLKARLRHILHF